MNKKSVEKLSNNNIISLLLIFNYLVEIYYDKTIIIEKRNEFNLNLETISNDVIHFLNNLITNIKQGKNSDKSCIYRNFFKMVKNKIK